MAPVKKEMLPLGKTFIAHWRTNAGMSQEELAEKINMSRSTLSKIETSDSPYTQRTLEAIAQALDCRPADLLQRPRGQAFVSGEVQVKDLLRKIEGLPEEAIHTLWRVISGFLEDAGRSVETPPPAQSEPATRRREPLPSE